jgi:hypothetical protein
MSPLVREILLKGLVAGSAMQTAKKTSVGVAYYAAAGAIGLLGIVFLAIAAYGLLLESFSMPIAASILGGVIMLIAAGVALIGYLRLHKKHVRKPNFDGNFLDSLENTAKSLLAGFEGPVKDNPTMAVLLAAIAGFAAADQMSEKIH